MYELGYRINSGSVNQRKILQETIMEYGQISGNKSINKMIYRCFEFIHDEDAPKFVKKFERELNDNAQVMHTFRELILGAYLASRGLDVGYERSLAGKYPDWCVLDESSAPQAIVEITNFHIDQASEIEIEASRHEKGMWIGWLPNNEFRLYESIRHKANIYKVRWTRRFGQVVK